MGAQGTYPIRLEAGDAFEQPGGLQPLFNQYAAGQFVGQKLLDGGLVVFFQPEFDGLAGFAVAGAPV
jgi:hypothetical protein